MYSSCNCFQPFLSKHWQISLLLSLFFGCRIGIQNDLIPSVDKLAVVVNRAIPWFRLCDSPPKDVVFLGGFGNWSEYRSWGYAKYLTSDGTLVFPSFFHREASVTVNLASVDKVKAESWFNGYTQVDVILKDGKLEGCGGLEHDKARLLLSEIRRRSANASVDQSFMSLYREFSLLYWGVGSMSLIRLCMLAFRWFQTRTLNKTTGLEVLVHLTLLPSMLVLNWWTVSKTAKLEESESALVESTAEK